MKIECSRAERLDIAGLAAWFEELAQRGLYPAWYCHPFCFLKKGEPRRVKYTLEPVRQEREPDGAMLELYEATGWEYVCRVDYFFVFSTADLSARDPYSDGESRAESMTALYKSLRYSAVWGVVVALAIIGPIAGIGIFDEYINVLTRLPAVLIGLPVSVMTALAWMLIGSVRELCIVRRLRAGLKQGFMPPYPGRKASKVNAAGSAVFAALLIVCGLYMVVFNWMTRPEPISDDGRYPMLTELEGGEGYVQSLTGIPEEDENVVETTGFSILAPVQYEAIQSAYGPRVEGKPPKGVSATVFRDSYHPHSAMRMQYFGLTLPFMARLVAKAQMDVYHAVNLGWEFVEVEYPGTDFFILGYANGEEGAELAAVCCDGRLAVYSYYGSQDLADHLDELAAPVL